MTIEKQYAGIRRYARGLRHYYVWVMNRHGMLGIDVCTLRRIS